MEAAIISQPTISKQPAVNTAGPPKYCASRPPPAPPLSATPLRSPSTSLGNAITTEVKHLKLLVVDLDQSRESAALVRAFAAASVQAPLPRRLPQVGPLARLR